MPASEFSDVFISYRRKDVEFVKRLTDDFKQQGKEVWIDWEDIPPGVSGFAEEIKRGLQGADTFLAVLSPDYLESTYCVDLELSYAVQMNKKIIPIVLREFEGHNVPKGIEHINWIYFTPHAGQANSYEDSFAKILDVMQTDLDHVRNHKRYLLRAIQWDENQRDRSFLLNGAQIEHGQNWLSNSAGKEPLPTDLHKEYLIACVKNRQRQQRVLLSGISVALAISIALSILSLFLYDDANANAHRAEMLATISAETQKTLDKERFENGFAQGKIYMSNGQFAEASVIFTSLLELRPDDFELNLLSAQALFNIGDFEQAQIRAERAVSLNPEELDGYYIRAQIYAELERWTDSISDYDTVLEMQPENAKAYYDRAIVSQNRAQQEGEAYLANLQLAFDDFSRAIEYDPNYAAAYNQRGYWYLENNDNTEAVHDFDMALAIDDRYAAAYGGRSVALLNLDNVEDASDDFNRMVNLQPDTHFEKLPVDLDKIAWFNYYGNTTFAYTNGRQLGYDRVYQGLHGGIDFGIRSGSEDVPIVAGVNGEYVRTMNVGQPSQSVVIQVGDYQIHYFNIANSPEFTVGDSITPDTYLGIIRPDPATNHLHLEVRYREYNMLVNPLYFTPPILIREILDRFSNFEDQFYHDENWTLWQDPFNQPVLKLAGPVIGPTASNE